MKTVIVACLIATICYTSGTLAPPPMAKTPLGHIEGVLSEMNGVPVKSFLGIPYAEPPLGNLRFLKPKPVEPWNEAFRATEQPPACMQYSEDPFPWYDDMPGKSEDCLYLNIFAPYNATESSKLAVIFWIHGGVYIFGSNRQDLYDGRVLASTEDVIVVTINYRLGLFGFLTTNTSDAPGNVALYDSLLALQWVNDNIEYFGGDKNRITISGESSGAFTVSILCISPLAKGLFSRAIMQSGSFLMQRNNQLEKNLELSERLAEAVGCAFKDFTIYDYPSEVVNCLKNINATYLTETLWSFNPHTIPITAVYFEQYGDDLLPFSALDDVRNGNFNNVPLLVGVVRDEGSCLVTTGNIDEFGFFGEKDPKVNKTYATTLLSGLFSNYTDPQNYVDFYLNDAPDDDYDQIRKQVTTAFGDTILFCTTVYFAESFAKQKNDVYFYFFNHIPSNTPWAKWMGVVHFEEIQFVFGRPLRVSEDYNSSEISFSRQVMKLWANFARDGNPDEPLKWPIYSNDNQTYLTIDIDNYGELGTGPHLENCNFLRSYFGF